MYFCISARAAGTKIRGGIEGDVESTHATKWQTIENDLDALILHEQKTPLTTLGALSEA